MPTLGGMATSETKLASRVDEIEINEQAIKSIFEQETPVPVVTEEAPVAAPAVNEADKVVEEPVPVAAYAETSAIDVEEESIAEITAEQKAVVEEVTAAEPIVEAEAAAEEVVAEAAPKVVEEPAPVAAKKAVNNAHKY